MNMKPQNKSSKFLEKQESPTLHSSVFEKLNLRHALLAISLTVLAGCMSTDPSMGGSSGNLISGGAAGGNASNENSEIESCVEPLGTISLFEDQSLGWWQTYRSRYPKLGSTTPVIRTMIQQSNCFVIVERGAAMASMNRERQLMQSGQLRNNSNVGGGQMVAADYTVSPSIQFSEKNTGGLKGIAGGLFGSVGAAVGGGLSKNEAATTLLLIDNRSGVQVASSVGNAGNYDFDIFGGMFAFIAGGAKGYSDTPEGKVLMAAFADSYNQMVMALRNYKPQQIRGGMGTGGQLKVDGGQVQATQGAGIVNAPAAAPVLVTSQTLSGTNVNVNRNRNLNIDIDEYDERALKKYYDHLKNFMPYFTAILVHQNTDDSKMNKSNFLTYADMFVNMLDSSRIELEAWPQEAKAEGWKVLGKRIESYNKMFYRDRDKLLASEEVEQSIKDRLQAVTLITKESLLGL